MALSNQQAQYDDDEEEKRLSALEYAQQKRWGMTSEQYKEAVDRNPGDLSDVEENAADSGSGLERASKKWGTEAKIVRGGENSEGSNEGNNGTESFEFKREGGKAKVKGDIRSRVKNRLKQKKTIAALGGSVLVLLLIVIMLFLSSLKLQHFIANITAFEFARTSRNLGRAVADVTEEKVAVNSADEGFTRSLQEKYNTLRSKTWGKLDKYRPQKVLDNMKADSKLEYIYDTEPRKIRLPGMSENKEVLSGVRVNGEELRFNQGKWYNFFENRNNRLEFNGRLTAQLQDALSESNTLVRGKVGTILREDLGIKLRRWERLTKPYTSAKAAEADNIRQTYEQTKTQPSEKAGVSAIDDAEKAAAKEAEKCAADPKCLEQAAKDNRAAFNAALDKQIAAALDSSSVVKAMGKFSLLYSIALPVCMIYEGSLQKSGSTIDANISRNIRMYDTVASGSAQQIAGQADPAQIGGLNDELGNVSNSPSELQASGKAPTPDLYSSPEAAQSSTYFSIFDALVGGTVGGIIDTIVTPVCPYVTDPRAAVALFGLETAAKVAAAAGTFGTGAGAVEAGEEAAQTAVQASVSQILGRLVRQISLKDIAKKGVRDAGLIAAGTILANVIVRSRMGNMKGPIADENEMAVSTHQGAISESNYYCQQELYCRPQTKPENAQSKYDDLQDIAFKNSQKSVFERYLSPSNPTSALSNTAIAFSGNFKSSITTITRSLLSKIGSLFQPQTYLAALTSNKASAAVMVGSPYHMVQWGWTDQEEQIIQSRPDLYSPINNAETLENSGRLEEIKSTYDKCFTSSMGTLLSEGLIKRSDDGDVIPDEGLCAPNNLGPNNEDAFRFRLYMRNNNVLDHLNSISELTASGGSDTTPSTPNTAPAPISSPGLNGYTVACTGQPAAVKRLSGPRADWTGIPDSGTIGNDSAGNPIKVYIREACDKTNMKTIVVVGGIHGTENGGGLVGWELLYNATLPNNVRIVVVPELNGSGIAANTRKNSNGVDLNRNEDYAWASLTSTTETSPSGKNYKGPTVASEPETKAIDTFLGSLGKVDLSLHYHDNLSYVASVGTTPGKLADIYSNASGLRNGKSDGNQVVTQRGSLDAWYNSKFGTPALLIELSSDQSPAVISKNVSAVQAILSSGELK